MATDDVTETSTPCLCRKGEIVVSQRSPDHPYARESQTVTTATIKCKDCDNKFVISNTHGSLPSFFRRTDVEAHEAAKLKRRGAESRLEKSVQVARLKPRIREYVFSQKTMADQYRALRCFGLLIDSLPTYRKNRRVDYDDAYIQGLLDRAEGRDFAHIGSMHKMGGDDVEYFKQAAAEIGALEKAENIIHPIPVKTDSRWLKH